MSERTDELLEDVDGDTGVERPRDRDAPAAGASGDRGLRGRVRAGLRDRLQRVFSPRQFGLRLGALAVGFVVGSVVPIPLIGWLGRALGVLAAGVILGVGTDERRYLETGLAGGLLGAGTALIGKPIVGLFGFGGLLFSIWAVLGIVLAVGGQYMGRDLARGFQRELE